VIATALVRPVTATGVVVLVVVLFPNCPDRLAPQHLTVPAARSPHAWNPPAATVRAPVPMFKPITAPGLEV
jgi:hypothetical protein